MPDAPPGLEELGEGDCAQRLVEEDSVYPS